MTINWAHESMYEMTPEKAAAKIVRELLADLPPKRQKAVRKVIEEYAVEWGDLMGWSAATSVHEMY